MPTLAQLTQKCTAWPQNSKRIIKIG